MKSPSHVLSLLILSSACSTSFPQTINTINTINTPGTTNTNLLKVTPEIIKALSVGTPQEAYVTFDDQYEMAQIEKKFDAVRESNAASAEGAVKRLTESQEHMLVGEKEKAFARVRNSVFKQNENDRIVLLLEFPAMSAVKIRLTDMEALNEFIKDPRVLTVSPVRGLKKMSSSTLLSIP